MIGSVTQWPFSCGRRAFHFVILRRSTIRQLRELNRTSRSLDDTRTAERLQVERRIFDLEAEARWLDRVEALTNPTTPKES